LEYTLPDTEKTIGVDACRILIICPKITGSTTKSGGYCNGAFNEICFAILSQEKLVAFDCFITDKATFASLVDILVYNGAVNGLVRRY